MTIMYLKYVLVNKMVLINFILHGAGINDYQSKKNMKFNLLKLNSRKI